MSATTRAVVQDRIITEMTAHLSHIDPDLEYPLNAEGVTWPDMVREMLRLATAAREGSEQLGLFGGDPS